MNNRAALIIDDEQQIRRVVQHAFADDAADIATSLRGSSRLPNIAAVGVALNQILQWNIDSGTRFGRVLSADVGRR